MKWFIFRVEMNCIIKGARLCCMTVQAPNTPTTLEIEFEKGDPVAINGVRMSPATILTKLNEVRYVWLHMLCVSVCMSMKVSIPNFGQFKSPAHVYVSVCVSMKESIPDFGQFGSPLPSTACAHVSCNPTNSAETKSAGLKCSKHARVLISLSHCVEERRVLAYSVPSMHAYWSYCVEKRRVLAQSVLSMHACWSHCIGFMCWV